MTSTTPTCEFHGHSYLTTTPVTFCHYVHNLYYKNRDVAKRSLIGRQRRPTDMRINVTWLIYSITPLRTDIYSRRGRFQCLRTVHKKAHTEIHFGRSVCSCCQTAYCWTSCFLCRWRACMERSSCRRHFSTFSVHFPKTFKTASLFTLLSWPCPLN